MLKPIRPGRPMALHDLACAGLRAIGEQPLGHVQTSGIPVATLFTRRTSGPDTRVHHYVTFDGRIWIGAAFGFKQSIGKGQTQAILLAGQPKAKPAPRTLELEDIGL